MACVSIRAGAGVRCFAVPRAARRTSLNRDRTAPPWLTSARKAARRPPPTGGSSSISAKPTKTTPAWTASDQLVAWMERRAEPGCFRVRPLMIAASRKHPTCTASRNPGIPDFAPLDPDYGTSPDQGCVRQKPDLLPRLDPRRFLVELHQTRAFGERAQDSRAVAGIFAGFDAAVRAALKRHPDVFPPPLLLAIGKAGAHRERDHRVRQRPGEAQQQRPHDPDEGNERRDRVAGYADEGRALDHRHRDRPSRLDGDAPEHQLADGLDRRAHVIGLAGRDAARGEHEVMVLRRGGERGF